MFLFYNVVYVYVCKIGEEKLGGSWWSFSWLRQSNPLPVTVPTNPLDHSFSSGQFNG